MDIHSSIIRDEVKELEHEMSIGELMCLVPESTLIEINIVLEDLAITRIVDRGEYD